MVQVRSGGGSSEEQIAARTPCCVVAGALARVALGWVGRVGSEVKDLEDQERKQDHAGVGARNYTILRDCESCDVGRVL
jgi:hypothetical protein